MANSGYPERLTIPAVGRYGTVEYAVDGDGKSEAADWLDHQPLNIRAQFGVLFVRLVNEGRISNSEQFKQLEGQVCEFKRGEHRFLCYRDGSRYLLTHRVKKGPKKAFQREIKRAQEIGEAHLSREALLSREKISTRKRKRK
jgi:hypothetical protein